MYSRKRYIWLLVTAAAVLLIAFAGINWLHQARTSFPVAAEETPNVVGQEPSPAAVSGTQGPDSSHASAVPNTPGASPFATAVRYDPSSVKVGDQLAGLKVIAIEKETYGKGSILTAWQGRIQLSGSYEYLYQDAAYNSGQVIFIPDAESARKLPQPKAFEGQSMRFVLDFPRSNEKMKFGPPGSRGTAEITTTGYCSVYAGILEGTSDSATVESISSVQVTLPPKSEMQDSDLHAALKDFPVMKQIKLQTDPGTLTTLQDWIYQVNSTMYNSLAQAGKRISAEQRQLIRIWLTQAFTDEKALELLDHFAPASEGGYMISGGFASLKPASEVKELRDQQFVQEKDGSMTYKVTYVISGTQDAHLTCKLEPLDSQWKIAAYSISYY